MSVESQGSTNGDISSSPDGDFEISHIKGFLSILLEGTPLFEEFTEANTNLCPELLDVSSSPLNNKWIEKVSDELCKETDISCGTNSRGVPQKLVFVLRECVLMHRWCEASQVLAVANRETTCDLQFDLWKVGMEILYSEFQQQDNFVLAERLMKLLNMLPDQPLLSSYMHTEYLLLQTTLADPEKTMRVITTGPAVDKKYRLTDNVKKGKCYQSILLAYQGLLWYKLWLKTIKPDDNTTDEVGHGISLEHVASSYLDKMTECFFSFYHDTDVSSEVRDIFILPHVRVLEHCQKFDEAKELLETYCTVNPRNPNAYKYYYDFLCQRNSGSSSDEQLEVLKSLAAHVPSDPLVLTLCEHLQTKDEELPSCLTYLMDLLDHHCWKEIPAPWMTLVEILEKLHSINSLSETLDPLWSQRQTWWPYYHFPPISVPLCVRDPGEKDLFVTKVILALFLRDPQLDSYIEAVEKLMDDDDKAKIISVKMFLSES